MSYLLVEHQEHLTLLTLNRPEVHNAFNNVLIKQLIEEISKASQDQKTRVIILKANGNHFSAGADLTWMAQMANASETENQKDAEQLAALLHTLYHCPKPTIAQIQGAAYGGGAGLVAACDIAVADTTAKFCFSEVKLGLIPAVISPFVIQAMGARITKMKFMMGEPFTAQEALNYQLIHHCVEPDNLETFTLNHAKQLAGLPSEAVKACKKLVHDVFGQPINSSLLKQTAQWIAERRVSVEAKENIKAFLEKSSSKKY